MRTFADQPAQGVDSPTPMPRLSKLATENVAWTQFVTQQRQTDRGLYSIMAGRYPQLNHAASSMPTTFGSESPCPAGRAA